MAQLKKYTQSERDIETAISSRFTFFISIGQLNYKFAGINHNWERNCHKRTNFSKKKLKRNFDRYNMSFFLNQKNLRCIIIELNRACDNVFITHPLVPHRTAKGSERAIKKCQQLASIIKKSPPL